MRGCSWLLVSALAVIGLGAEQGRAGNIALPNDLGVAGFFEPFMLYTADSGGLDRLASDAMTVLDTDGDGRDEILIGFAHGNAWREIRRDATTGIFDFTRLVPLPLPGYGAFNPSPTIVSPLSAGGAPKALVNLGRVNAVYDARSGVLERISDSYWTDSSVPLGVIDMNGDGQNEIVLGGGSLLRVENATLTRELGVTRLEDEPRRLEYEVANFDNDAAIEMATSAGEVFKFENYRLRRIGTLPSEIDGLAFIGTANLDSDPQFELIGVYGDELRVFDVDAGTVKWRATLPHNLAGLGAARLRDMSGDGVPDVIVATNGHPGEAGTIAIYDGKDGHELRHFSHPDLYVLALNVGDFDGSGKLEIATLMMRPFTGPNRLYVFDSLTGAVTWRSEEEMVTVLGAAQGDVDGDGADEIVSVVRGMRETGDIRLVGYDATTYTRKWKTTHQILPVTGTGQIESLAIGDVDGDGHREIAIGLQKDGVAQVVIVSGQTRQYLRAINLQPYDRVRALEMRDLDGDGHDEIIAAASAAYGSPQGARVFVLDGASGQVVHEAGMGDWPYRYAHAMRTGDVSGDGHADMVMVGDEGGLTVVDGMSFAARGQISATPHAGLALVDVEGDAALEIVVGKEDGSVQVLRASDFSVIRTFTPCSEPVDALQSATLTGSSRGDVYYGCGDGVGLLNLRAGGTARRMTGVIGGVTGIGNLLWARGTAAAPRITVSTLTGLRFLTPSAAVAPYVLPWRNALPQAFVTPWHQQLTDVITFDDYTGRPANLELIEGPGSGTFQLGTSTSSMFTYTAARPGLQHITLRATDGLATSVPVTLSINATNGTPAPYSQTDINVTRGVAFNGVLNGMDPDGDPVQFQLVSSTTKGALTLSADGRYTYTSTATASGDDTFTYIASDTFDQSPVVSVLLHIQEPVSTPPPSTPPPQTPPPSAPAPKSGGGGGLEILSLLLLFSLWIRARITPRRVPHTTGFW